MVPAQIQICRVEMAEGRVQDRANEPAARGSDKCPFGTRTSPRLRPVDCFKPGEIRTLPPAPQALFGVSPEEMPEVFAPGYPSLVTIGHPKGGKSVLLKTVATQNHHTIGRARTIGVTPHCAARFAR
jgi:hypothetical protein